MSIKDWPLHKIMQLPDEAFGARWPVGIEVTINGAEGNWGICQAALPEWTVIWELYLIATTADSTAARIKLALGDQMPVTQAAFDAMEVVFPGIISSPGVQGDFQFGGGSRGSLTRLRTPIHTAGRRFVADYNVEKGVPEMGIIIIVISSLPTEVPEWLNLA